MISASIKKNLKKIIIESKRIIHYLIWIFIFGSCTERTDPIDRRTLLDPFEIETIVLYKIDKSKIIHQETLKLNVICDYCQENEYLIVDIPDSLCYSISIGQVGRFHKKSKSYNFHLNLIGKVGMIETLKEIQFSKPVLSDMEWLNTAYEWNALCIRNKLYRLDDKLIISEQSNNTTFPKVCIYSSVDSSNIIDININYNPLGSFPSRDPDSILNYIVYNLHVDHLNDKK